MSELRACPFCGGKGRIVSNSRQDIWEVTCAQTVDKECLCENGVFDTEAEAIAAWNRRVNPLADELAKWLEFMLDKGPGIPCTGCRYRPEVDCVDGCVRGKRHALAALDHYHAAKATVAEKETVAPQTAADVLVEMIEAAGAKVVDVKREERSDD